MTGGKQEWALIPDGLVARLVADLRARFDEATPTDTDDPDPDAVQPTSAPLDAPTTASPSEEAEKDELSDYLGGTPG